MGEFENGGTSFPGGRGDVIGCNETEQIKGNGRKEFQSLFTGRHAHNEC